MSKQREKPGGEHSDNWSTIVEKCRKLGIDLESLCSDAAEGSAVKIVCVDSDLSESIHGLSQKPRAETVMVRMDEQTRQTLDSWVETGYFKSRSEAAALFIQEGLKTRTSELENLRDAIQQVKKAKKSLQIKAQKILGAKGEAKSVDP